MTTDISMHVEGSSVEVRGSSCPAYLNGRCVQQGKNILCNCSDYMSCGHLIAYENSVRAYRIISGEILRELER